MTNTLQVTAARQAEVKAEDTIEPLVVSLATASRLLGVSDRHVRSNLHQIPHIRIGGRLLFRVESLRSWLVECEQNGAGTPQKTASPEGGE